MVVREGGKGGREGRKEGMKEREEGREGVYLLKGCRMGMYTQDRPDIKHYITSALRGEGGARVEEDWKEEGREGGREGRDGGCAAVRQIRRGKGGRREKRREKGRKKRG